LHFFSLSHLCRKTPLGVLSLAQVERGDAVLDRIQAVLDGAAKENLEHLSSEYVSVCSLSPF
jgi:hypothetical protein